MLTLSQMDANENSLNDFVKMDDLSGIMTKIIDRYYFFIQSVIK